MKRHIHAVVTVLALGTLLIVQADDAWARARSGGSRGSRSFSAPVRPSPATPTSPSRSIGQPQQSPMARYQFQLHLPDSSARCHPCKGCTCWHQQQATLETQQ